MNHLFTIGEMSKLHRMPVKTLRYYDEIGLFKPIETAAHNGYRYYSTEQFEQLNTIQYLKALGLPLSEIKAHMERRDFDHFHQLLIRQKEATEEKILELERSVKKFKNRIRELEEAKQLTELGVLRIKELPERRFISLRENLAVGSDIELMLRKLENDSKRISSIYIGGVGFTISKADLLQKKFDTYNSIFLLVEDGEYPPEMISSFPAGPYASLSFRGDYGQAHKYYVKMLEQLEACQLQLAGDAIKRTIIDSYISNNPKDYLTELQIPIA